MGCGGSGLGRILLLLSHQQFCCAGRRAKEGPGQAGGYCSISVNFGKRPISDFFSQCLPLIESSSAGMGWVGCKADPIALCPGRDPSLRVKCAQEMVPEPQDTRGMPRTARGACGGRGGPQQAPIQVQVINPKPGLCLVVVVPWDLDTKTVLENSNSLCG